jgi:prolipoprotein diacylglyceryl transferase
MIWDIDPIAFHIVLGSHRWPVHWYGLFFASTFVYGTLMFRWLYAQAGKPDDHVYDLVMAVIAGTLIGARLGHTLIYNPGYYLSHPWKILFVWEGGLASHGAVIGILLAVWLYARWRPDQSFLWICDRIGMAVPLSGFLIRTGNFFNSEILGIPSDAPWAVVFSRVDQIPRHPVQLYEALGYLLVFALQFRYYLKHRDDLPLGNLFGRFFAFVFGVRFLAEFFKEGQAAYEAGWALTMGQLLSLPAVLVGVGLIAWSNRAAAARAKA